MEMHVYCCADGALLLVPACCQPSIEAQHLFGPFRLVGRIELDESAAPDDTFEGIEQHTYALVEDIAGIQDLLAKPTFRRIASLANTTSSSPSVFSQ